MRPVKRVARTEHLPSPAAAAAAAAADPAAPAGDGQYYGYLHHEARGGLYQLVALNLKDHAGVATLYFGEGDSSEFVAFKLAPDEAAPTVLDGGGDAFLVLDSWQGPYLTGTWYSKSFGRVGTVELEKDLVPQLSHAASTMGRLSGIYQGDAWRVELTAQPGVSERAGDYDPLKVYGWAQERLEHARRRTIDTASFDFYTGVVAFHLDDGRIALGRVAPGELQLHWPPKGRPGTILPPDRTDLFQRVGGELEALAP